MSPLLMDIYNGWVNLAAIVGTLIICIGTIPVLFLASAKASKGVPPPKDED